MKIGRIDTPELYSVASQRLRKVCTVTDEISVQRNPNSKVNNRDYFAFNEDGVYPRKDFADAGLTGLTGMGGFRALYASFGQGQNRLRCQLYGRHNEKRNQFRISEL